MLNQIEWVWLKVNKFYKQILELNALLATPMRFLEDYEKLITLISKNHLAIKDSVYN